MSGLPCALALAGMWLAIGAAGNSAPETPPDEQIYDLAELFKVFVDSTRMSILFVLFESDVCICDIANVFDMTVSAISHQLKILKQSKLVKSRRESRSIFYSLADEHVRAMVSQGMEHIREQVLCQLNYGQPIVSPAL